MEENWFYVVWCVLALVAGVMWQRKGMPFFAGLVISLLMSPLVSISVGFFMDREASSVDPALR